MCRQALVEYGTTLCKLLGLLRPTSATIQCQSESEDKADDDDGVISESLANGEIPADDDVALFTNCLPAPRCLHLTGSLISGLENTIKHATRATDTNKTTLDTTYCDKANNINAR